MNTTYRETHNHVTYTQAKHCPLLPLDFCRPPFACCRWFSLFQSLVSFCLFFPSELPSLLSHHLHHHHPHRPKKEVPYWPSLTSGTGEKHKNNTQINKCYIYLHTCLRMHLGRSAFFSHCSSRKVSRKLKILKRMWCSNCYCCFYLL